MEDNGVGRAPKETVVQGGREGVREGGKAYQAVHYRLSPRCTDARPSSQRPCASLHKKQQRPGEE